MEIATTEYAPKPAAGTVVIVDHGHGTQTFYAHLGALAVHPGEPVRRGDVLARVGVTGLSTGPHLHLEVWQDGAPVDPGSTVDGLGEVER